MKNKSLTIAIAFMLLSFSSFSQATKSQLMNKVWKMDFPASHAVYNVQQTEVYTANLLTVTFQALNMQPPSVVLYDYYLSNTIDTYYDGTKAGNTSGKYIVTMSVVYPDLFFNVFEIVEITETRLVIRGALYHKKVLTFTAD